jgi:hypothetical protein
MTEQPRPSAGFEDPRSRLELPAPELAKAFEQLVTSLRAFQDMVAGVRPDVDTTQAVTALIDQATAALEPYQVDEWRRISGWLFDAPARGLPLIPPFRYESVDEMVRVSGSVSFSRYFLGGNHAAHGGSLPLLFDEICGRVAGMRDDKPCRTAYLRVDYRGVTPIDRDLQFAAWLERYEGRKVFVRGTLHDGDRLCAEVDSLFVVLNPGQP